LLEKALGEEESSSLDSQDLGRTDVALPQGFAADSALQVFVLDLHAVGVEGMVLEKVDHFLVDLIGKFFTPCRIAQFVVRNMDGLLVFHHVLTLENLKPSLLAS